MIYPEFIKKWFSDIHTISLNDSIFDNYPEIFEELRNKKETIYYLFNFTKILNNPQQIIDIRNDCFEKQYILFIFFYIKLIYKIYFPEEYEKAIEILQTAYDEVEDFVYNYVPKYNDKAYKLGEHRQKLCYAVFDMLDMTYFNMINEDNIVFNDIFIDAVNSEIISTYMEQESKIPFLSNNTINIYLFITKLQIWIYNIFSQLLKRMG